MKELLYFTLQGKLQRILNVVEALVAHSASHVSDLWLFSLRVHYYIRYITLLLYYITLPGNPYRFHVRGGVLQSNFDWFFINKPPFPVKSPATPVLFPQKRKLEIPA